MNSCHSKCKESIRQKALELGAVSCGMAKAEPVGQEDAEIYLNWLSDGCDGEMEYCRRYTEVRNDPRLLLEGAATVISIAFSYYNDSYDTPLASRISRYAWGLDYHYVIKDRLNRLASYISENFGGECRAVVDSAPIRERYWAVRSGIGYIGLNGQLIIPGAGSYCFLGEVIWTGTVRPDPPSLSGCGACMACVKACPGQALDGTGRCDARRCVSYLTIEHRGSLDRDARLNGSIYGCDVCQEVCPHNRGISTTLLPEFIPENPILKCCEDEIMSMTSSHYRHIMRCTAMQRVPLKQLIRNIQHKR